MGRVDRISVIDLFAGPGGLGEGFSAPPGKGEEPRFKIRLSIEKDPTAHQTLELRALYRQFGGEPPDAYYRHLRGEISREELFGAYPGDAFNAKHEAWLAELGAIPHETLRSRIETALEGDDAWVLIGGPPCQAYSLVGRSRNKGIEGYSLAKDPKSRLYLEYLQLIADFWPSVFVMENVKGLLSSEIDGELIFEHIRRDLSDPAEALKLHGRPRRKGKARRYKLRALSREGLFADPSDFVVRCERHGIPQARHRVIIVGVREDLDADKLPILEIEEARTVDETLRDLPKLRSGLSKESDDTAAWADAVLELCSDRRLSRLAGEVDPEVVARLELMPKARSKLLKLHRGSEFVPAYPCIQYERWWFVDEKIGGACNHSTRSHIRSDLHRYLFAAAYAEVHERSPELGDFPKSLLPDHENVKDALKGATFADRFRVQHRNRYSTTVTSHISKDGHYYIHYDPMQCRSLTVREAARLQTFPDSYLFCGGRTGQYIQVGNAVPPLLARKIAACVHKLFE